jgi:hypothetical protein
MKSFGRWFNDQAPATPAPIARGENEGDVCNRQGCTGELIFDDVEGCTCFISPPCSACVNNPLVCDECSYEPGED